MVRIDRRLLHPPVQHRLVNIEIARGPRNTDTTFPNQSNCLELELTSGLATLHGAPPASPSHLNRVSVKPASGHIAMHLALLAGRQDEISVIAIALVAEFLARLRAMTEM